MTWLSYAFSFRGRMNRAKYWLFIFGLLVAALFAFVVFINFVNWFPWSTFALGYDHGSIRRIEFLVIGVLSIPIIACAAAVSVKRLHDRDKSVWWLTLILVPIVLSGADDGISILIKSGIFLLALIQLGIMRGTAGPNRHGGDPIEGRLGL